MRWVLQHVCQVPFYLGMGRYMPGSSCFSSFNLHNDPFYRWGNWDLEEEMIWSHEPENLRSEPGLSLWPKSPVFSKCLKATFPGEWIREGIVPNSLYPWWWFNKWYAVEMENKDQRKYCGKCGQGKCLWVSFWFGVELPGSQGKKWYELIHRIPLIKIQRSSSLFQNCVVNFKRN